MANIGSRQHTPKNRSEMIVEEDCIVATTSKSLCWNWLFPTFLYFEELLVFQLPRCKCSLYVTI